MSNDISDGNKKENSFHLAGIIPVAGQKLDFNFPWHDCFMPVAQNYLAIENAIYQCVTAGCETIWIVAHKEMQPLLRHRIGDWVYDPVTLNKAKYEKFSRDHLKEIPIYYVPIHPKDRDKRDCLAWSVIYGSLRAFHISKMISRWVVPDKYFVSFPYGICSIGDIRRNRLLISDKNNFYMQHNGKTIKDGEYLPFTFDKDDFLKFRRIIRQEGTGVYKTFSYDKENNIKEGEKYPIEERYSARHFDLAKVFGCATIEGNNVAEAEWYYGIDNWENYIKYMSSQQRSVVKRPKHILKYHEWNPVGVDNEDLFNFEEEKDD